MKGCSSARWAACVVLAALGAMRAAADQSGVHLGGAEVRFDREHWRASMIGDAIRFEPQGRSGSRLDEVELRMRDDSPCRDLALRAFQFGHYDTESLQATPIKIGGVVGERFEAHTGCRNATPRGVVACVKHGGRAYLVTSLNAGCEGRNLFSGIDPIADLAAGISFGRAGR